MRISDWRSDVCSSDLIVIVVFFALSAWALLSAAIERYLNSADTEGNVIQRSQRVRTLIPLMQKTAFVVITLVAGLIILSEIGIDIGPLLAGAGIIGQIGRASGRVREGQDG